jgi:hypothetical protein
LFLHYLQRSFYQLQVDTKFDIFIFYQPDVIKLSLFKYS